MCGIAGVFEPGHFPVRTKTSAMLDALVHRGPDDHGIVERTVGDSVLALGTRRLAIQDLSSSGHQPMLDEDSGNILVFNGEIYNAPDLRSELQRSGHRFRGSSDTEVVLRGYLQWGEALFDRLRGMFGLAIWDQQRQTLVLVRDPLGIKPLYYLSNGTSFAFASEVRALQASGIPSEALDDSALMDYLAYGSIQDPRTIFLEIRSLLPGHIMRIQTPATHEAPRPYWDLPEIGDDVAGGDAVVEQGRELLKQSVARHLLSDVPVGVFLSSGLDSSLILHLARQQMSDTSAFTVTLPDEPDYDEGVMARAVAKAAGASHVECPVAGRTATKWAVDALDAMDQPTTDGLNTFIVSRAVHQQGLKVALSGQGGDEMFGGYRSFTGIPRAETLLRSTRAIAPRARYLLARKMAWRQGEVAREKSADMARVGPDLAGLYLHSRRLFSDRWLERLGGSRMPTSAHLQSSIVPDDPVASIARFETSTYLQNTLLRDGDVFGMANSLEIRVPMLDQDLLEWTLALPGQVLLPPKAPSKHLLRKMFPDLLLPEQLQQAKRGFELPLASWLRGPLASVRQESLATLKGSGLVDQAGISSWENVFAREPLAPVAFRMWSLVVLGHWLGTRT